MQKNCKNQRTLFILLFIILTANLAGCKGDGAKAGFGLDLDESQIDSDKDGIMDSNDNCSAIANVSQRDSDQDGVGDACENESTGGDDDDDDSCTPSYNILYYADADSDGYGTNDSAVDRKKFTNCDDATVTRGYSTNNKDCDDTKAAINPGAAEIYGDGVDQNCAAEKYIASYAMSLDSDLDGTPNKLTTYTFDVNGLQTSDIVDDDISAGDGNEHEYYFFYDAEDRLIAKKITYLASTYAYMEYGDFDLHNNYQTQKYYQNCDSTWTTCILNTKTTHNYTYDGTTSNITADQSTILEYDATGATVSTTLNTENTAYTYNTDGSIATKSIDETADGTVDQNHLFFYDESARLNVIQLDSDGDRVPNSSYQIEYTNNSASFDYNRQRFDSITTTPQYLIMKRYNDTIGKIIVDTEGTISTLYEFYDEHGGKIISYVDSDGDGDADANSTTITVTYATAD